MWAQRRKLGGVDGGSPYSPPPIIGRDRSLPSRPEHESGAGLRGEMGSKVINHRWWESHRPSPCIRLRWSFEHAATHLHRVVLDADRSSKQVDVNATQPRCFTEAEGG